ILHDIFFFSSRRRHTRFSRDWSSDVCSSDLGFIPREADKVFERKFGDCKDMTSIITEMAKYVNVPNVNFTWIGTRELPYTYQQLPTPAVDNHMIATYIKDGKKIYLDATDANVPFGMPSGFIQGKEV